MKKLQDFYQDMASFHDSNLGAKFPVSKAEGRFRSWNTDDLHMMVLHRYIDLFQPKLVVECGTFEGRFTEYAASRMATYGGGKIVTIDVGKEIADIRADRCQLKESPDPLFEPIEGYRKERIDRINADGKVKVEFVEGVVSQVLSEILGDNKQVDFLFMDGTHSHEVMKQEMHLVLEANVNPNLIICWDDVNSVQSFQEWVESDLKDWFSIRIHHHLWMQKREE